MTPLSVEPCTLALFGALGDLALRKLFPALYQLDRAGLLPTETRLLALARESGEAASHLAMIEEHLRRHVGERDLDEAVLQRFMARLDYLSMDFRRAEDFAALADKAGNAESIVAFFATPASVYGAICAGLAEAGLAERTRVVLEKPIGHDLESSREVNDAVARFFPEDRTYRIDHYLGKDTVQNLIALRFANSLFETQWNQNHISHVEITVAETVGIEGRWGYFDQAGQLRDMIQNHLLQLLCLIAMDPPSDLSADSIRDEKVKVLKALAPIAPEHLGQQLVRGQYVAGSILGRHVPGYLEEENSNTQSDTETFVALRAEICNWRWAGVPFYLRTGKRMPQKLSQIVIHFKAPPHYIFAPEQRQLIGNKLIIRLQPQEGISLLVMTKDQGLDKGMQLRSGPLQLNFSETYKSPRIPDAYERLLLEVMKGNQNLFVRKDEIEYAWKWCDQLIDGWQRVGAPPKPYAAGSWGPAASIALISRDGRSWYDDL
ncbi:glucose-6-phosphate dehydrogenase [Pseudomonas sp. NP21570]|uniref:Glucose-6-phosphate dehydrogenase n=1 Tax=Stutzerimonas chloritidismutans TaxID=203192 RepID=A0ACC5VJK3_STUCH|nr:MULTISPECIES: glucose-6-phosphate dehydrogenase [Stutzerimonas stutzeri subgroup]KRW65836.1 glucose-6-phosphate dehydrogenase [Pseudomonas sp. TTU2014-105ASC]MBU0564643.1 glucose-6-phosphate dehydrogenase [Gammaproteobacteria bacterium]MCB4793921.1 glucose-6-phosphate dehydrogenase [Pseudomonas sp. NP21570]EHY78289.1 glucose-6-phosphate 1-dehydrogenase [Stutzerimonas stutzeri ATCC 14405 = CCUG 16156]MBA1240336.1 glucose-6-phosphate dehydrogenase [Stutzerimonas kunmingensis]